LHHSGVCAGGYEFAVNGKCKIIIIIIIIVILRTVVLNFSYNRSYTENLDQRCLWRFQSIIHLIFVFTHLSVDLKKFTRTNSTSKEPSRLNELGRLYGEVNSPKKHNYKIWLNVGGNQKPPRREQ